MSSNRTREIRRLMKESGQSYERTAREVGPARPRLADLLAGLAAPGSGADPGDCASVLHTAWSGLRTLGAAAAMLALCADPDDYRPRLLIADHALRPAIRALRTQPQLWGRDTRLDPAGAPGDRWRDEDADRVRIVVIAAAQTLGATLERAAPGLAPGARRAVRASAVAALHINACYRAEPTIRPTLGQGAGIWPPTIPRC